MTLTLGAAHAAPQNNVTEPMPIAASEITRPKIRWAIPLKHDVRPEPTTPENQPNKKITVYKLNVPAAAASTPTVAVASEPKKPLSDAAMQSRLDNEVRVLWDEIDQMEKMEPDITVLPIKPIAPPTAANKPNKLKKIDADLRHQRRLSKTEKAQLARQMTQATNAAVKKQTAAVITTPIVAMPQLLPKPVLTRREVLQLEIDREKAALKSAKAQMTIALKRGNTKLVSKLATMIRDRELNVQAISRELTR